MAIDTQIRRVTPPNANLFADLGLTPAEAAQFQAAEILMVSRPRVADVLNMKA